MSDDEPNEMILRDIQRANQEINTSKEWLELARKALKRSKQSAEPHYLGEIDALHDQIGDLKHRMNNEQHKYQNNDW